ncbi:MAG TPA: type II toxin-antitoxin system Phd/YefM family antitoxin [Pseudonocardiaceae bacterium]
MVTQPTVDISFRATDTVHVEVSISHARAHLPELLDEVREGATIYLTRYGKRLAALVPAEAAEHLEQLEDTYWSSRANQAANSPDPPVPWTEVVAELEANDGP